MNAPLDNKTDTPSESAFGWYLTSSSLWVCGMSLQGFLISWMLVDILEAPADQAGFARSLIDLPGIFMVLLGGIIADRVNARTMLLSMHTLMALPAFMVGLLYWQFGLNLWGVIAFGVVSSIFMFLSDPARQAILSRVTQADMQRAVARMTVVTSVVGLAGVWLGGRLEEIGLAQMLFLQSLIFLISAVAVIRLPDLPIESGKRGILEGVKALWNMPLLLSVIGLNFISSLFNAGAYIIGMPYIVNRVYEGDAAMFSAVMMIFTIGSISSNIVLLKFMPLLRPGRLFLMMQLTRMLILLVLWTQPPIWLFFAAILAWGLNMGTTTTMVRAIVQTTERVKIFTNPPVLYIGSYRLFVTFQAIRVYSKS
ncbi:MAG: MFS transporter, partial [Pseudomonadota bacterium]